MSQVIGNWSVDPMYSDSISTPKTVTLVDIDYSDDISEAVSPSERIVDKGAKELYYTSNTGTNLVTFPESVYYGKKDVKNVYSTEDKVGTFYQLPQKGGTRVYCTLHSKWMATNSVNGEEKIVPLSGTISIQVPNAAVVNTAMVEAFMKRLMAYMFGTGQTDGSMAARMLRGDLDPT